MSVYHAEPTFFQPFLAYGSLSEATKLFDPRLPQHKVAGNEAGYQSNFR